MRSGKHILVIDDDIDVRNVMTLLLRAEGYHVATAANGRDALDYLNQSEVPDLILLDVMMPVMDGWQFMQRQQQDPALARIPIIILSAASDVARGAVAHFQKPVPFDQLLETVRKFCWEWNGPPLALGGDHIGKCQPPGSG
jgi:two-component system chemotaxis response regulator CheY